MKRLKDTVEEERPPCIIAVGDTVTKNLEKNGFKAKLSIVDNKCMRRITEPSELHADQVLHVTNPPGTITAEAISTVQAALKNDQRVQIVVDGEEDLLTLVAVIYAPTDSYIVYGQPYEGIVLIKATAEKKAEISAILRSMEKPSKS
jgi:hypothetical protein